MEWDYGDYEGITTPEIRERAPALVPVARRRRPTARPPTTSRARVDRVIAEARPVEGDVALVAHGHVLRVLAARWLEAAGRVRRRACTSAPAAICVLGWERDVRVIDRWNQT